MEKISPPSPRGIILSQMSHVLQFDAILLHSAIIVMHKTEIKYYISKGMEVSVRLHVIRVFI